MLQAEIITRTYNDMKQNETLLSILMFYVLSLREGKKRN